MKAYGTPARDDPDLLLDINTTPLIDVMLVLLIMFIVTIPIQPHATSLLFTQGKATAIPEPRAIQIQIGPDQKVEVNGTDIRSREDLGSLLKTLAEGQGEDAPINVDIHPQARYDQVASVLAQIQRNGLKRLNIVGIDRFSVQ